MESPSPAVGGAYPKVGGHLPPAAIFSFTFHFRNDDVDYDSEQTGMLGGAGVVGQGRKVI